MNELIPITINENQEPIVSGRTLHEFLEVGTRYNDWIDRKIEYGFAENEDYTMLTQKRVTNNPKNPETTYIDHAIKVDMAKEICMLEKNAKGKQARQYFIQIEKDWNSPEKIMARALKIADRQISVLRLENSELVHKIEADKPKTIFADAVATSKTSILVGEMAKILKQNGVDTGQNRFFEWLRSNSYLIVRNGTDYNMPTQKSMELGLFEIKETSIVHSDGHTSVNKTPKVTGKGQQYFVNLFLNKETI